MSSSSPSAPSLESTVALPATIVEDVDGQSSIEMGMVTAHTGDVDPLSTSPTMLPGHAENELNVEHYDDDADDGGESPAAGSGGGGGGKSNKALPVLPLQNAPASAPTPPQVGDPTPSAASTSSSLARSSQPAPRTARGSQRRLSEEDPDRTQTSISPDPMYPNTEEQQQRAASTIAPSSTLSLASFDHNNDSFDGDEEFSSDDDNVKKGGGGTLKKQRTTTSSLSFTSSTSSSSSISDKIDDYRYTIDEDELDMLVQQELIKEETEKQAAVYQQWITDTRAQYEDRIEAMEEEAEEAQMMLIRAHQVELAALGDAVSLNERTVALVEWRSRYVSTLLTVRTYFDSWKTCVLLKRRQQRQELEREDRSGVDHRLAVDPSELPPAATAVRRSPPRSSVLHTATTSTQCAQVEKHTKTASTNTSHQSGTFFFNELAHSNDPNQSGNSNQTIATGTGSSSRRSATPTGINKKKRVRFVVEPAHDGVYQLWDASTTSVGGVHEGQPGPQAAPPTPPLPPLRAPQPLKEPSPDTTTWQQAAGGVIKLLGYAFLTAILLGYVWERKLLKNVGAFIWYLTPSLLKRSIRLAMRMSAAVFYGMCLVWGLWSFLMFGVPSALVRAMLKVVTRSVKNALLS